MTELFVKHSVYCYSKIAHHFLIAYRERNRLLNVPNVLVSLRFMLTFVVAELLYRQYFYGAFAVFVIGSVTDYLDGKIARAWDQKTATGALFDTLVDKIYILWPLYVLMIEFDLHPLIFYTIAFREVVVLSVRAFADNNILLKPAMEVNFAGKCKMVAQCICVAYAILQFPHFNYIMMIAVLFTLYSLYSYSKRLFNVVKQMKRIVVAPEKI
ncbi:MAG: CDP-alcohol phosphatidyltransferase family protein [bacterium]|nr:CDP-alcohol phosphatidyltransferase family protein [bacterium]